MSCSEVGGGHPEHVPKEIRAAVNKLNAYTTSPKFLVTDFGFTYVMTV